ncbi:para-aminobenzoate synthetase component 1 [Bisgaardia hudsonensis]|uniref:Para-aminobenzoate synthetase component 1 n=1 Tax=Bisgaardia hudsonensis TaxID=109472 RepID=A0A4R2MVK3_9PAST|nr:aminodeoxychorismate synthase component I [Bisgaardia hudsonensis]QLB12306.1 aminodeoxychorismate synthase component I [Bisgaardia hudsonensis]TCP12351.1 para-aminobenzoate synthetase component 1 [Bisgaardia hudsonensis]
MPLTHFIQQANQYGEQRIPFFFLIDFEQQASIICPINEAKQQGIFFDIKGMNNIDWSIDLLTQSFYLEKFPMEFSEYQRGFNLVQQELQKGNSYLLNLTYPTKIHTNYNLKQIFQESSASYKLLFENKFVCFSPEPFIHIKNNQIFTFPMKGTINAEQENAKQILLDSNKEQCEHYTIVDLMRNDLAIVAKNIEVTRFRYVEKIYTEKGSILQTSSEITGELEKNWQNNIGNILSKLLPAGSISGAPKEKTVQVIQQAEKQKRGYYTGIFGLFNGDTVQSAVAIRFIEQQGENMFFRSGGGITIQSNVEDEFAELIQKVYIPLKHNQ